MLWFSNVLSNCRKKEYTHLNPQIQTDMFLQPQSYDTRPGNWLCCPGRKRNRRERSADMVSSDGEYSARDVERLADAFMYAAEKINLRCRPCPNFQWANMVPRYWTKHARLLCAWQRENKHLPRWLVPIKTQSDTLLILMSFPSAAALVSTQDRGLFPYRSMWEMAG